MEEKIIEKTPERIVLKREEIETIDIEALRARLENLKNQKKPTDKEVLELAKQGYIHPYYDPRNRLEIDRLEEQLKEIGEKYKIKIF